MSKEQYPYPEDEFDTLGAGRVPQGVHREPAPRWRQWLPYLLVLVLVPLLTFGAVKFLTGDSGPVDPLPTAEEPADDGDDADADADDQDEGADDSDPSDPDATGTDPDGADDGDTDDTDDTDADSDEDATEDPETPADLDYSTHVLVLNGAGVQGLAGQVTEALTNDGWTNTTPDNYESASPTVTSLYYTSEEFAAEAAAVAESLGITNLIESATGASNGIVIVLRSDFQMPAAL